MLVSPTSVGMPIRGPLPRKCRCAVWLGGRSAHSEAKLRTTFRPNLLGPSPGDSASTLRASPRSVSMTSARYDRLCLPGVRERAPSAKPAAGSRCPLARHWAPGLAADVWSMGCTILEMATAERPWGSKSFDNIFAAMRAIGMTQARGAPRRLTLAPGRSAKLLDTALGESTRADSTSGCLSRPRPASRGGGWPCPWRNRVHAHPPGWARRPPGGTSEQRPRSPRGDLGGIGPTALAGRRASVPPAPLSAAEPTARVRGRSGPAGLRQLQS